MNKEFDEFEDLIGSAAENTEFIISDEELINFNSVWGLAMNIQDSIPKISRIKIYERYFKLKKNSIT